MTENETRLAVENIVSASIDAMYGRLDRLHKQGINDDDVARTLRELGHNSLASGYIDWQNDGEEPREDEDGPLDQGEHLVTDPGDMPSYNELEQALLDAVNANKISHGIFFAERSNDGVHWHVYKKRNHEDNGAYIATADHREGAQFILNALGTGTTNYIEKG
jgi:hypothetical protein